MATYSEKLQDPRWQRKRLEIMERDSFRCRDCGAKDRQLHIHHTHYQRGNPWDTESCYLLTLCAECHESRGDVEERIKEVLGATFALMPQQAIKQMWDNHQDCAFSHWEREGIAWMKYNGMGQQFSDYISRQIDANNADMEAEK